MNTYIAFWKTKQIEVTGGSSFAAQQNAAAVLCHTNRNVKVYDITVVLAERDGTPVVHSTGGL
tara:strand:+ start:59 stop:247 length:189 start_codon:yes stop_codon:yes gene_type:complete